MLDSRLIPLRFIPAAVLLACCPAGAAGTPWKSAVASYETAAGPVSAAIDGRFDPENGWSVRGGHEEEQSAAFVLAAPMDAGELQVRLSCLDRAPEAYPISFEIAVTRDPSPNLESEWTPLWPAKAVALRESDHANVATVGRSLVTTGITGPTAEIVVRSPAPFPKITGFRLNLVPTMAVSRAGSVSRNPEGACTITEFEVVADPLLTTNLAAGRPPEASGPVEEDLPAYYLTDAYPNTFTRPKSELKSGADFHFEVDLGRSWALHHVALRRPVPNSLPLLVELRESKDSSPLWSATDTGGPSPLKVEGHPPPGRWLRVTAEEGTRYGQPNLAELEVYPQLRPVVVAWSADGHPVAGEESPPRADTLRFELSTAVPIPLDAIRRFRFRVPGWKDDWQETDARQGITLVSPPAGSHRLELQARHADGVWDDSGQPFPFVVPPVWWQNPVFFLVSAAVAAFLLVLAWRQASVRKLNRRLIEARHENTLQRDRLRIARDMHDDIGARLTQLAFLADAAEQDAPASQEAPLAEIAGQARETVAALDQIVWAVNPRNDTVGGFADYLGIHAGRYLSATGIRLREEIAIVEPSRPLEFDLRHDLLMACKEALQNLVKHAGATCVQLAMRDSDDELLVSIADDGRGFIGTPEDPDQSGLANMRERLAEAGGSCTVDSSAAGTRVTFILPLRKPPHDRH